MDDEYSTYGTDEQLDKYAVEVMNGDGYYNSEGSFIRYRDPDAWWNED